MMRPVIFALAIGGAFAASAAAQPSRDVVLGRALPEMNMLTCNSAAAARAQAAPGFHFERFGPGCEVSLGAFTPLRIETSVPAFRAPWPSYVPGARHRVQNRHLGAVSDIPIAFVEQTVRVYYGVGETRGGERYYTYVFVADEPYHSRFLAR